MICGKFKLTQVKGGIIVVVLLAVIFSLSTINFAGASNFQARLKNNDNYPVYHRAPTVDQTTVNSLRNILYYQRELVATPKIAHTGNAGKITLKKVKHPPMLEANYGWGWQGEYMGWGGEIKEHEESHKETEGWGWKKPEETEGWGWKKPEKEESELKKLIGVVGPLLFPLPFLLASLPLAVPAIGLTVLGKRRNITFQTLKPSTETGAAAGEGRHVYTILQNNH